VDTMTLVIAAVAAGAIILIAVGVAMSGGGSDVNARLARYASTREEKPASAGSQGLAQALQSSEALAQLNKVVEQRDFGANLAREIARADLRLKPSEYIMIWIATTLGVPLLMVLLSVALPTLRNPLFLVIGALIGFMLPRFWLGRRKSGRLKSFNKQLPDTITLIANALRAGSSFLQAIELVVRESRPPISTEFGRVIREVNLGLSFEVALENMVRRVRSDVGFLPIALAGFLFIAAPGFMQPMFDDRAQLLGLPMGVVILAIGGFAMFMGFMFIRRIVDIEV
jgi:tight adherence protein B